MATRVLTHFQHADSNQVKKAKSCFLEKLMTKLVPSKNKDFPGIF
jgi:hypothetical protein